MAILVQSTPVSVVRYYPRVGVVALQCYQSTPEAVVPVAPVLLIDSGGCRSITPVAIVPGSSGSGGCRSITVAVFQSLRWLSFQGLQWLLFQSRGPVAVDPVAAVAVVPVLLIQGSSISFSASVDMDDYQKRSPVENVLGSTGDSHVVVSNRVHGKHSICW